MERKQFNRKMKKALANRRRHNQLLSLVAVLSSVVVLVVFLSLMNPATTMTSAPICGMEEHTHSDACYMSVLTCGQSEGEEHTHTDACYSRELTCGRTEHVHSSSCYMVVDEPALTTEPEVTAAPAQEPTDAPADTEAPAIEDTAAPTESTTDEPTAEPTADPISEPDTTATAEATATPEATSTPEPTIEVTATPEPTAEPTATPNPNEDDPGDESSPVRIYSLTANHEVSITSAELVFNFEATGAEGYSWVLTADNGYRDEGRLRADAHTITFSQLIPGNYTLKLTATATVTADGAESTIAKTKSCKVKVITDPEFEVKATTALSGFAGESVSFHLSVSDNDIAKAAKAHIEITQKGTTIFESNTFQNYIAVTPVANEPTELQIKVTLVDEFGRTATAQTGLPIAIHETENEKVWKDSVKDVKLTGVWQDDLLAIARSQLGYTESQTDFIIKEDGEKQGWTRYGAKAGLPYEEWCCMYVSFCLDYANVPTWVVPRVSNQQRMRSTLISRGFYISVEDGDYEPQPGDLIFFDHDVNPWDEGHGISDHIGIVTGATASKVYTIEGNHTFKVAEFSYDIDFPEIVGYCPLSAIYAANEAALAEQAEQEGTAILEGEAVTIQALEGELPTDAQIVMVQLSDDITASLISDYIEDEVTLRAAPRMMSMSALPAAAPNQTGSVSGSAAFDIGIMDGGAAYTESGSYAVTVYPADGIDLTALLPDGASMTGVSYTLTHIHDGAATQIPVEVTEEDGVVDSFTFVTDSFSPFVLQYTVDFEFEKEGEVYQFSMEGGSSIRLSALFAALNIDVDITDVASVSFSDETFIKVSAIDGDWELESLQPFDSNEMLTITLNDGVVISVSVTDEQHVVSDVTELLTNVTIDATQVDGKYVVYEGQPYGIHLTFKENPNGGQLNMTDGFSYPLPDGIDVTGAGGNIKIKLSGGTQAGKEVELDYTVENGVLKFTWPDQTSDAYNQLKGALYTGFTVDIEGLFKSDKTTLKFSDTITKELDVKSDGKANVSKTGSYNAATNSVDYTVTVTSQGICQNVVVQDTISGTALTYNNDAKATSSKGTAYTPTTSGNGFSFTIPQMGDGETVTVKYSASVDLTKLSTNADGSIGTVEQTGNKVTVTPSNHPGDEDETSGKDFNNKISYSTIAKKSSVGETGEDGHATVTWTIKANEYANVSMAGHTISDQIADGSQSIMKYSGTGITVVRRDSSGRVVSTETIPWGSLTSKTDSAWTWTVPNQWPDTEKYSYEITYTTDVDVSDKLFNTQVNNTATSDNGGSSSSGGDIKPAGGALTARKSVISRDLSNKTITWEVNFDVPATGLSSAQIVDTLPLVWVGGAVAHVDSYKDGTITVTPALEAGEGYTVTTSKGDDNKEYLTIDFYKMVDGQQVNGLLGTGSRRKIRVQFQTEIDEKWLEASQDDPSSNDLKTHTNNANVILNGQTIGTQASTKIDFTKPSISKSHGAETVNVVLGDTLPTWQFYITLTGITDDAFDDFGQIVIEDTYNGKYLDWVPHAYPSWETQNGQVWGGNSDDWHKESNGIKAITKIGDGVLKIVIDRSTLPMMGENDDEFYPIYTVPYYLTVKDSIAYNKLIATAAQSDGGTVELYNTAKNDDLGETTDKVDYKVPVIDKSAGNAEFKNGNWVVHYTIKVNEKALQLGDEDELVLTDDYTNISVDYTTVKIYKGQGYSESNKVAAENVSWNRKGNTVTYYLQNATSYVIEYDAKVVGEGKVVYTNTAEVFGVKDTETHDITISSSGSGDSVTYGMQIFKHEKGAASTPLSGTVFDLFEYVGTGYGEKDSWQNRPADNKGVENSDWKKLGSITTGEDGVANTSQATGSLKSQTWYALWETTPPTRDGVTYEPKTFSYVFWITEGSTPDYSNYVYVNDDVVAIDNSPTIPDTVSVTVTKAWPNDPDDEHAPVTVHLYADGDPIAEHTNNDGEKDVVRSDGTITLGVDGNWTYTWSDLPGGLVYSVVEDAIPGYTTTYSPRSTQGLAGSNTITISNKKIPNKTSIAVQKVWAAGATETEDITVQLKRKVSANIPAIVRNDDNGTIGATLYNTGFPAGADVDINYTWLQDWGTQAITCTVYNASDGSVIKSQTRNLAKNESDFIHLDHSEIPSSGIWIVFNGKYMDASRYPTYFDVEINATGGGGGEGEEDVFYTNERHYYTLNADNNWQLIIDRLPLSDDDGSYTYYIEEVGVNDNTQTPEEAGYVVTYSSNNETGITEGTITVTNKNESVDAEFVKNWVNTENRGESSQTIDNTARLRVEVQLLRGYEDESGEWVKIDEVGEPVVIYGDKTTYASHPENYPNNYEETTDPKQGDQWSAKWKDLPAKGTYNGETVKYDYRVEERSVYAASSIDSAYNDMLKLHIYESDESYDGSTTTITNTFKVANVSVQKTWDPEPTEEDVTVTVQLQRRLRDVSRNYDYSGEIFPGEWQEWEVVDGQTISLTAEAKWTADFENLPKFGWRMAQTDSGDKFSFVEYEYQVVETGVTINGVDATQNYTTAVTEENVGKNDKKVTITNTISQTTEVTATKQWKDTAGNAIAWPNGVQVDFQLYADNVAVDGRTVTLDGNADNAQDSANGDYEDASQTAHFVNLPINNDAGETIAYTVREVVPEDAVYRVEDSATPGTIVNVYTETTDLYVQKRFTQNSMGIENWRKELDLGNVYFKLWRVDDTAEGGGYYVDENGAKADKVFTLTYAGTVESPGEYKEGDTVYINPGDELRYAMKFTGIPVGTYQVRECDKDGNHVLTENDDSYYMTCDEMGGQLKVMKNIITSLTAAKEWDDKGNTVTTHPDVTFKLQQKIGETGEWTDVGTLVLSQSNPDADGHQYKTGTAADSTEMTFPFVEWTDLPVYDIKTGQKIAYRTVEVAPNDITGYKPSNTVGEDGNVTGPENGKHETYKNELEVVQIEVTKTWDPETAPENASIELTLTSSADSTISRTIVLNGKSDWPDDTTGEGWDPDTWETYIQSGNTETAHEINPGWVAQWSNLPKYSFDSDGKATLITYTVTETGTQKGYNVRYSADGTAESVVLNGPDDDNKMTGTVTNVKMPSVNIVKTDGSGKALAGAVFELHRFNDANVPETVSKDDVPELNEKSQFTVPEEGITLTGLMDGKYELKEISPPDNYVIISQTPVTFTVANGVVANTEGTIKGVTFTAAQAATDDKPATPAEFSIPNTQGVELPSTGGSGTWAYTLIGVQMLALAGAVLLARRRFGRRKA